jgi:hypothetical protein
MITNEYSQEAVVSNELVIPQKDYHKLYVKQSKIKHVLFALFMVALLVAAGIFLNSVV